ncbi:MAG: DEAD/DEAH box helicase [Vulcanisaeta sp. AZ3]|nr:MAG: hypothetical protein TU36_01650 [Vulcanisaeta sp. AZ3]
MLFRVIINSEVEVRRVWDWDRVSKVKDRLKELGFRWNGEYWSGKVYSLSLIKELKELLDLKGDEIEKILKSIMINSSGGVIGIENIDGLNLPSECILGEEGGLFVVSLSCLVRNFIKNDRDNISSVSSFEEYVDRALETIRGIFINRPITGDLELALKRAKEFTLANEKLKAIFTRRLEWWTAKLNLDHVELHFLSKSFHEAIRSLTVPYYVVDKDGSLIKHDLRLVRKGDIERGEGRIIVRFPIFIRDKVKELLIKSGYKVIDNAWAPRTIQVPKDDIKLLPFQEKALKAWLEAGRRGTVVVPTGGGKTFIALKALAMVKVPTIILVITEELMNQWYERIMKYLGVKAGRLGGGFDDVRDVTVAIYNSAVNRIMDIRDKFDLAIFDEAHHVPADTFKEVAFRLRTPYRLALSATPRRSDNNEHLIFLSSGDIVYQADYRDMVETRLVVPVRHFRVYVDLTLDERRSYEKAGDNAIVLRNIASMSSNKIKVVLPIIKAEASIGSKILVFTQFIKQAEELYNILKNELGSTVALITSKTSDRDSIFKAFAKGVYRILVATTVLDEGIDVPDADVAIIMSGTGSQRQMIQRVGRVVRATNGKVEARIYEIVTRNTIEEALSEERHIKGEVLEVECKRYLMDEVQRLINHIVSSASLFRY